MKFLRSANCAAAPLVGMAALLASGAPMLAQEANPPLSANVLRQIQAMTDEKSQRTDAQKKIDSAVLHAARAANGQVPIPGAPDLALSQLSANNLVQPDGRILVDITTTDADGLSAQITSLGGIVVASVPQFDSVRARLPASVVETVAAVPSVKSVRQADIGYSNRMPAPEGDTPKPRSETTAPGGVQTNVGKGQTISQGVVAHGADIVQNLGTNGYAQKVCVISDGIDTSAARQSSGNLPTIGAIGGQSGAGDEGTAMLELVADLMPGATELDFATAINGPAQMAQNILTLNAQPYNCQIIVDDWSYYAAGAFQEDVVANAVTTVTGNGALYFSSAANSGRLTGNNSGTWEGDFSDGGTPPTLIGTTGNVHSFGSALFNTLTQRGNFLSLKWSDAIGTSSNDYDLFVVNSGGTAIISSSTTAQNGTQNPYESINCSGSAASNCPVGARIYIKRFSGAARALRLDTHRGRLSIATNGSTYGHNGGINTISVAAVPTPSNRKFNSADQVETYSSDGPRRLFINPTPQTTAITPGCVLYSCNGGRSLPKVDIAASDCVTTTTPGFIPFCGTSAAAPQAAAISALVKSAFPGATPTQVFARMKTTAIDIMAAGSDIDSGAGIVMADAATAKAAHDYNGNVKSDILWRDGGGALALWTMKGATAEGFNLLGTVPTNWTVVAQRDFDGDGITDILWGSSAKDVVLWLMNGATAKSIVSLGNVGPNWTIVGSGDFDGPIEGITYNGQGDILWRNSEGTLVVWTMKGSTIQYASVLGNVSLNWSVVGVADFNGDGASDILWRNTDGTVVIWFMKGNANGTGSSQVIGTSVVGTVGTNWSIVGTADYNGDRKSDILWRNTSGDNAMWLMNGPLVASVASMGNVATSWSVASSGDYNGDGKGDILWRSTAGDTVLWQMNGPTATSVSYVANVSPAWVVQNINAD